MNRRSMSSPLSSILLLKAFVGVAWLSSLASPSKCFQFFWVEERLAFQPTFLYYSLFSKREGSEWITEVVPGKESFVCCQRKSTSSRSDVSRKSTCRPFPKPQIMRLQPVNKHLSPESESTCSPIRTIIPVPLSWDWKAWSLNCIVRKRPLLTRCEWSSWGKVSRA